MEKNETKIEAVKKDLEKAGFECIQTGPAYVETSIYTEAFKAGYNIGREEAIIFDKAVKEAAKAKKKAEKKANKKPIVDRFFDKLGFTRKPVEKKQTDKSN